MRKNLTNFFSNIAPVPSESRMWTTFKSYSGKLSKARGVPRRDGAFAAMNSRATNDYREKTAVAYLVNRYYRPHIKEFFAIKGLMLDDDALALSEMLQFIFRSAVREGNPIQLYIPSYRMRRLLQVFMTGGTGSIYDFDISEL